jgi:hypothetical protein
MRQQRKSLWWQLRVDGLEQLEQQLSVRVPVQGQQLWVLVRALELEQL